MLDLDPLVPLAARVIERAIARGVMLSTAESCTGGLVAGLLTSIAGSSAVVDRGFVTYSNDAKADMLGVEPRVIARVGAVSDEVAVAMAEGALGRTTVAAPARDALAVSITGIAGPGGGTAEKPVGLVHFAAARTSRPTRHVERRFGDLGRDAVRLAAAEQALKLLEEFLSDS
jgi:nicotinamide-nucleotide amidase